MNPTTLASLSVVVAYLIGAIPFAYLFVKAAKGIDIRTVGSGNVGATNASRVLGIRGFLLVFVSDMLKGYIPTVVLPAIVKWRVGHSVPDLPIFVALATIVGHNFPIYLNFRGGKGVSTSLGAALGLDWMASLASVIAFGISLRINRYVSLSSMIGAAVFAVVHFLVVIFYENKSPWDRDHLGLSLLTLGLLTMMLIRHRHNFARIMNGTEPKISRKRKSSGSTSIFVVGLIALIGIGLLIFVRVSRRETVDCGLFTLTDLGRFRTGHQRATHPVFADKGQILGVLCPRYNRLMIYRVDTNSLALAHDVTLDGQPMALATSGNTFWVLERPSGDARHIKPGFVQAYNHDGAKSGPSIAVGFYPSEIAIIRDGRVGLVLTSGMSEGEAHHGLPALEVLDLANGRVTSKLAFDKIGDSPSRLSVSMTGMAATVTLDGTKQSVAIDLFDPAQPKSLGRSRLPHDVYPYLSLSQDDSILMPVESDRQWTLMKNPVLADRKDPSTDLLLSVSTESSELEVRHPGATNRLGRLILRGSSNFGDVRPTGVAYSPQQNLVAISSRSGGVHLVEVRPKLIEDPRKLLNTVVAR